MQRIGERNDLYVPHFLEQRSYFRICQAAAADRDAPGQPDVPVVSRCQVHAIEDRPGAASAALARVAGQGVSIDLVYLTARGELVLGGDDPALIQRALAATPAATSPASG